MTYLKVYVAYLFMLRNIKLNEICGKISYHREDKLRLVLLKSVISFLHYLHNRRSNNVLTVAPRLFLFSSKKQTLIWESENERFILGKCSIIFTFVLSRKHFHIFLTYLIDFGSYYSKKSVKLIIRLNINSMQKVLHTLETSDCIEIISFVAL